MAYNEQKENYMSDNYPFDEDEIKKARSKLVTKIGLQEPKETDSSICRKIYNGWIGKEEKIAEIVPNIIKAMNSLSAENLI
jgi:hypothetical protein